MKLFNSRRSSRSIQSAVLLFAAASFGHSLASAPPLTNCGNPEPTKDPTCGECEDAKNPKPCPAGKAGNDARSEFGPLMKIPGGASASPNTKQNFFQPDGSNVISKALDLEIASSTANLPLEFYRQYQSRVREGMSDDMGHGITWTHSFSYRMWVSSTNKRSIIFPEGTVREFTAGGNVTFEGATQIEHLPVSGRGERLYQGGVGQNWFTLILSNGARHVFERVTDPAAGTSLYHPRYAADAEGRRHSYTTDAKGRIIRVADQGGNTLSLIYGAVQIQRKNNILLNEVSSATALGQRISIIRMRLSKKHSMGIRTLPTASPAGFTESPGSISELEKKRNSRRSAIYRTRAQARSRWRISRAPDSRWQERDRRSLRCCKEWRRPTAAPSITFMRRS